MKKTNYYVLSLLMAAGLAACSAEIDSTQQQGDQVPLQLTATKLVDNAEVQESHARRAANNLYVSSFDGGESVKVWLNDTETSANYTINSTDHTTLEGGSLYYPAGSTGTATVFALYPATSTSSHTVAHNQNGDAAYKQSDLMYATKTVNLSEKTSSQALQFSHQLVKLHVNIVKGSGVTSITSVKMKNVKRTVSVTPANTTCTIGSATSASDGNGDEIIIFSGSGSAATQDYACVFPIQAWSDQDFIEITADGQTATYKLTRDSWTKGSSYTLTLNVNAATLGTTTSITGWTDTASATVTAGGGDFTISDISAVTYDGSAKTPTPTVSYNNNTLTLNDDYTLEYAGNINAGNAAVIAIGKGSYVGKVGVKEFTINKANPTYTAPTAATLTYTGSAQNLVTAGSTSHGVIKYATSENGDYSATIPQQTNAGTYNVWWKLEGDANHNDASGSLTSISIAKATPSVTAPTAKPSLLYTGSAQQLINAGSTTGGTLQYSLDQSSWSDDATTIKGTAAQSYTVYYKVVGNSNYNDVAVQSITASIVSYRSISSATTSDYGKVVCAAGHLHDAKTAVPSGCTAVGVLGKVTETGHGLIVALKNATDQTWNTINSWSSITSYASTTLKLLPDDTARGTLSSYTKLGDTTVSNWCVGQKTDYEPIFVSLGSTKGDSDGKTYDSNVNAYFTDNGDAFDGLYWSATEGNSGGAWYFYAGYWSNRSKTGSYHVRPVLAF